MTAYPLRSGASGPRFTGNPGDVLTLDASGERWGAQPGGGGAGLTAFNHRTAPDVVPTAGDYDISQIGGALATNGQIPVWNSGLGQWVPTTAAAGGVTSWNTRTGAVTFQNGDAAASQITNDSSVTGSTVKLALQALAAVTAALAIATAAPLAGGGVVQSGLTLSVAALSNASSGVAPAITAGNTVLTANGGGTAAAWVAPSGGGSPVGTSRAINTTSPLAGGGTLAADLTLSVGTVSGAASGVAPAITAANTFLGSTSGSVAVWLAQLTGPSNPGSDGRIVGALSGDLTYNAGTNAGNVPTWSGTAFDYTGTRDVLTTGGFLSNVATGFVRLGLAGGSGAGSAASQGNIRGNRAYSVWAIAANNTTDVQLEAWDAPSAGFTIGSAAVSLVLNAGASGIVLQSSGAGVVTFNATNANWFISTFLFAQGTSPSIQFNPKVAGNGNPFSITGHNTSDTGTVVGGSLNFNAGSCTASGAVTSSTGGDWNAASGTVAGSSGTRANGNFNFVTRGGTGTDGNISLIAKAANYQGLQGGIFLADRAAAPAGSPTAGFYQWSETGGLPTWRNVAGDVVTWTLTSAATATAGGGAAVPLSVSEFLTITYKGNVRKLALFAA